MICKNKGLTLIEIIVVIFIFLILLAGIFSLLATSNSCWKSGGSQLSVQQEARRAMDIMTKELRQGKLSGITGVPANGTSYNTITFQIPENISETGTLWSNSIQYSLGGLNNSQLLRSREGNQRVLANNISSLSFTRSASAPAAINISITAQKNTFPGLNVIRSNITLNSKVRVRN